MQYNATAEHDARYFYRLGGEMPYRSPTAVSAGGPRKSVNFGRPCGPPMFFFTKTHSSCCYGVIASRPACEKNGLPGTGVNIPVDVSLRKTDI